MPGTCGRDKNKIGDNPWPFFLRGIGGLSGSEYYKPVRYTEEKGREYQALLITL